MQAVLETERLVLREYVEEDAESFFRLNSDPVVMRFTGDDLLVSVEEARRILRDYPIADYQQHGFGRWACVLRKNDEVIGFAGLKFLPETGDVDLGYRLLAAHWGRGLATEACTAVVRYGFEVLQLPEISALVQLENVASVRVLEKCGLTRTGMVDYRGRRVARYALRRGNV
jgi:[ribosomal protein S5]-alanine N-acetyltransferase